MAVRMGDARWSAVGVVACLPFLLAGCGLLGGGACTAVGYSQTLTVHLEADVGGDSPGMRNAVAVRDVHGVRVCGGGACPEGPGSGTDLTAVIAERSADGAASWDAELMYPAEPLLVQFIGSDGAVLGDALVEPEWRRVGGSERCGGPSVAEVTLGGK